MVDGPAGWWVTTHDVDALFVFDLCQHTKGGVMSEEGLAELRSKASHDEADPILSCSMGQLIAMTDWSFPASLEETP